MLSEGKCYFPSQWHTFLHPAAQRWFTSHLDKGLFTHLPNTKCNKQVLTIYLIDFISKFIQQSLHQWRPVAQKPVLRQATCGSGTCPVKSLCLQTLWEPNPDWDSSEEEGHLFPHITHCFQKPKCQGFGLLKTVADIHTHTHTITPLPQSQSGFLNFSSTEMAGYDATVCATCWDFKIASEPLNCMFKATLQVSHWFQPCKYHESTSLFYYWQYTSIV